jgi:nucleotide-binding universal stress UspA family protein
MVESDSPAKAILSVAESAAVNLLVVGTRGLTGLREMTMGSVAHKVSAAAKCPVMIVR